MLTQEITRRILAAGQDCEWDEPRLAEQVQALVEELLNVEREACAMALGECAERYTAASLSAYYRTGTPIQSADIVRGLVQGAAIIRFRSNATLSNSNDKDEVA